MTEENTANIRINNKIIEINQEGLLGSYLKFCAYGATSGIVIGAYTGGVIGLGVTTLTPAAICYGFFKYGRKYLRK